MDKQTFYAELTKKLLSLGLSSEYVDRHISQFDGYFAGKSDEEVAREIEKLGDLDKVAKRIKRMTEKAIKEAEEESSASNENAEQKDEVINRDESEINEAVVSEDSISDEDESNDSGDEDVTVFVKDPIVQDDPSEALFYDEQSASENHGTKRGSSLLQSYNDNSLAASDISPEVLEQNRKKFWTIFFCTLPITLAVLFATAALFAFGFFTIAMIIIIAVGGLIFVTASGTLVSVFGLIFGASQMLSSIPVGLYECGISIMIGAFALALGVLVYNFAVRLMPYAAKWLLVFVKYVIRKYREFYVYLKKECLGL